MIKYRIIFSTDKFSFEQQLNTFVEKHPAATVVSFNVSQTPIVNKTIKTIFTALVSYLDPENDD